MELSEALRLVKTNVKRGNIVKHMIAVQAIMRALAKRLGGDEDLWAITGLLHDIDFDKTFEKPEEHGLMAERLLEGLVPEEVVRAIKSHNSKYTGVKPETPMEKALIAADAISGLLIACALVMPSKKIRDVKLRTVKKKFKDKDFARGSDRNRILTCGDLGITKEEFFEISLIALKEISQELSL